MKVKLTPGWQADYEAEKPGGRIVRLYRYRPLDFDSYGDSLVVRPNGRHWVLMHDGKQTPHKFESATAAIEHADDARIHGH